MLPCNYSAQLQQDSAQMERTGTVSDGSAGLSGMQLLSHGVRALKVVAMFPQGLVHLVADAYCVGQRSVDTQTSPAGASPERSGCGEIVTTFENNVVRDQNAVFIACRTSTAAMNISRVPPGTVRKVYRGCQWVWTKNTGYILPPGQAVLVTNGLEPKSKPFAYANISGRVPHSENRQASKVEKQIPLFSLAVSHAHVDGAGNSADTSCVIAPGVDLVEMPAIAAARNNITIAQNSPGLQAVWDGQQGRLVAGENGISVRAQNFSSTRYGTLT